MKSMVSTKKPLSIEGIPLITRFKTLSLAIILLIAFISIEGIPLITRFKTFYNVLVTSDIIQY